jgi:hypothetical protein
MSAKYAGLVLATLSLLALLAAPLLGETFALVHVHGPHDAPHAHWSAHDHGGAAPEARVHLDGEHGDVHEHAAGAHRTRSGAAPGDAHGDGLDTGLDLGRPTVLPDGFRAGTPFALDVAVDGSDASLRAAAQGRGWRVCSERSASVLALRTDQPCGSRPPNRSDAAPPLAERLVSSARVLRL